MMGEENSNLFTGKTLNEWLEEASQLPPIAPLFYPWWNEGEVCFFFGSSGIGKTLFAIHMAKHISQEKKILYFDFELSSRQLLNRYKNGDQPLPFPDNFLRFELQQGKAGSGVAVIKEVESQILQHDAKIVIIDNLTWILEDGQEAKKAIPFMKKILNIRNKHNASILIIGHTPKRMQSTSISRSGELTTFSNPITEYDMAGSMSLQNFIDSSFAIVKSRRDESLRYFKQIKERNSEKIHGEENVAVYRLEKDEQGYLSFTFIENSPEVIHLRNQPITEREEMRAEVFRLHSEGHSNREIARRVGITHPTVATYLRDAS